MIFSRVFAIHHPRLTDPFPPLRLQRLTQPCQANLRGETPPFSGFSTLSPLCSLNPPGQPRHCRGAPLPNPFRINTCESLSKQRTLTVIMHFQVHNRPLTTFRMITYEKHG